MRAQILSYSRSRGLFAGVSLNGAAIRQDRDSNEDYYGDPYSSRSIVLDRKVTPPAQADEVDAWWGALAKYVGKK
jgi:lipid-binding SYLF domain-containing protein